MRNVIIGAAISMVGLGALAFAAGHTLGAQQQIDRAAEAAETASIVADTRAFDEGFAAGVEYQMYFDCMEVPE